MKIRHKDDYGQQTNYIYYFKVNKITKQFPFFVTNPQFLDFPFKLLVFKIVTVFHFVSYMPLFRLLKDTIITKMQLINCDFDVFYFSKNGKKCLLAQFLKQTSVFFKWLLFHATTC